MSKIIGINYDQHITSAVLLIDGVITAAIPEERLSRLKRDRSFPNKSIEFITEQSGISFDEVDCFAHSWNPCIHMEKFNPIISNNRRNRLEYLYSIPDNILRLSDFDGESDYSKHEITINNKRIDIYYISHHLSHAANVFFSSGFQESIIVVLDGRGESSSGIVAIGNKQGIEVLDRFFLPNSLGSFYSAYTELLGFRPESDEWKVMALSAMSVRENEYTDRIRSTITVNKENGSFTMDQKYYNQFMYEFRGYFTDELLSLLDIKKGENIKDDDVISEKYLKIVSAMQCVFEELLFVLLNNLKKYDINNICLSGGSMMNSVSNGKVLENTFFDNLYIGSCPDDSGTSIGAAFYVDRIIKKNKRESIKINTSSFGTSYTDSDIYDILKKFGLIKNAIKSNNIASDVAKLISEGKIIGWFQGRSEFGQRALGNRSILADPRREETKLKINSAIKYRESFRPFAPSILKEHVEDYFHVPKKDTDVYFMEKVYKFKSEKISLIPAVVHYDNSGRLQSVDKENSPLYYDLINNFYKITKVPIIVNTSFNLNGEPNVETPVDAIRTFMTSGLDILAIGSYILGK